MYNFTFKWNLKKPQIHRKRSDLWLPEAEGGMRGKQMKVEEHER